MVLIRQPWIFKRVCRERCRFCSLRACTFCKTHTCTHTHLCSAHIRIMHHPRLELDRDFSSLDQNASIMARIHHLIRCRGSRHCTCIFVRVMEYTGCKFVIGALVERKETNYERARLMRRIMNLSLDHTAKWNGASLCLMNCSQLLSVMTYIIESDAENFLWDSSLWKMEKQA